MFILQTLRHAPESCPLGCPKNLDTVMDWLKNLENMTAKYGIKVVGVWTDRTAHTSYAVFEAPSMDAFTKFEVDPQNIPIVTFNHVEKRVVTTASETIAFFTEFKRLKQ